MTGFAVSGMWEVLSATLEVSSGVSSVPFFEQPTAIITMTAMRTTAMTAAIILTSGVLFFFFRGVLWRGAAVIAFLAAFPFGLRCGFFSFTVTTPFRTYCTTVLMIFQVGNGIVFTLREILMGNGE